MGNIDVGKKYIMNKTRVKLKCYQFEPALMSTCVTFIDSYHSKGNWKTDVFENSGNFISPDPKHYY